MSWALYGCSAAGHEQETEHEEEKESEHEREHMARRTSVLSESMKASERVGRSLRKPV